MYPPRAEYRLSDAQKVIEVANAYIARSWVSVERVEKRIRLTQRMIEAANAYLAALAVTVAKAEDAICGSRAFLAAQNRDDPTEPAMIAEPRLSYEEKLRLAHRLIAALREQGRRCELRHTVTLH